MRRRKHKIKIVDDWRSAWKWFSMQCMAASVTILGAWLIMPDDLKAALPPEVVAAVAVVALLLGIIGRLVNQKKGS